MERIRQPLVWVLPLRVVRARPWSCYTLADLSRGNQSHHIVPASWGCEGPGVVLTLTTGARGGGRLPEDSYLFPSNGGSGGGRWVWVRSPQGSI